MSGKKQYKRLVVRKVRRALNSTTEGPTKITGHKQYNMWYKAGIRKNDLVGTSYNTD